MLKKLVCIVLSCIMIMSCIGLSASAEGVSVVRTKGVRPGSAAQPVKVGDTVEYSFYLTTPENIENIQAVTYYDSQSLELLSTTSKEMFPVLRDVSAVFFNIGTPGEITFNSSEGIESGFDFTDKALLVTLRFKALDTNESEIYTVIEEMTKFGGGYYVEVGKLSANLGVQENLLINGEGTTGADETLTPDVLPTEPSESETAEAVTPTEATNPTVPEESTPAETDPAEPSEPQEVLTGSLKVEVAGGTGFSVSVDGGKERPQGAVYLNSKIPVGSKVTVKANSGSKFLGWVNPANGQILTSMVSYTFYTGGNDQLRAVYQTPVEGANSVIFKNDKSNQILDMQYYCAEDEISFPNKTNYVGYNFVGWDHTAEEITAKLAQGEDVVVVPVWEVQLVYVNLEVSGGEVIGHGGMNEDGQYLANKQTVVLANTPSEGEKFSHWEDGNGRIKSYDSEYTFYPATDVKLTAKYVAEDEVIDYKVLVNVDSCDTSGDYGTFNYNWFVPEAEKGYTFMAAGLVAVNKDNYSEATFFHGTTDTNVWDRAAVNAESKGVYNWTGPVMSGQTWMAKAWVQYKDAEGNLCLEYSDLFEVSKY